MFRILALLLLVISTQAATAAEQVLSVYGGVQKTDGTNLTGRDTDGSRIDFDADWEGRSLDMPPYWGVRYTYWRADDWGLSLDFTHVKLYADDDTLDRSGFEDLEFTDGLNAVTFGLQKRMMTNSGVAPYAGAGVGFIVPHVETRSPASEERTFEYQYGGLAAEWRLGVRYALADRWRAFAEYEGNYAALDVDMDGGGKLEGDIVTHAVNFGLSFVIPPGLF